MSGTTAIDEKAQKTVADYVGDIVALEAHIEEALDRQLESAKDDTNAHESLQRFHDMVKANRDAMKAHQELVGSTGGNPVIAAGAAALGKAAGLIDKARSEGISKMLRDDYTAFNHAAISYTMLHTTALALGDKQTADMAERGLKGHASAIQEINHIIADSVVRELKNDDHTIADPQAAQQNREMVDVAWKETDKSSMTSGTVI